MVSSDIDERSQSKACDAGERKPCLEIYICSGVGLEALYWGLMFWNPAHLLYSLVKGQKWEDTQWRPLTITLFGTAKYSPVSVYIAICYGKMPFFHGHFQ